MMKQNPIQKHPKPRPGPKTGKKFSPVTAMLISFGCGTGAAILLLAVFALVFERMALPASLARPFAAAAVAVGAAVSGAVLAGALARQRLLCGLGCGVFYAGCLVLATLIRFKTIVPDNGNGTLLAALLLGGGLGGALTAFRADGAARGRG